MKAAQVDLAGFFPRYRESDDPAAMIAASSIERLAAGVAVAGNQGGTAKRAFVP